MNLDGIVDLVSANYASEDVSVLYGFGDGRFWAPHLRPTGRTPHALALFDLDGDGLLDAVTANAAGKSASVLMGEAIGFAAQTEVSATAGDQVWTEGVAIGDVNEDGLADAVLANSGSDDLTVLAGDGAGGFWLQVVLSTRTATGGEGPADVRIADVTGDGRPDLVAAGSDTDDVIVLEAMGSGAWAPPTSWPTGGGPEALETPDIDGDGVHDVVVVLADDDAIATLFGDGTGALLAGDSYATGGTVPVDLVTADLDGDGWLDVAVAHSGSDDVGVLFGTPALGFDPPSTWTTTDGLAGRAPAAVAAHDVDDDGFFDLVTANGGSDDATVLLGTAARTWGAPAVYRTHAGYRGDTPTDLAIADVTGDGAADLVVVDETSDDLVVLAGFGDGRFAPAQTVWQVDNPTGVVTADLDGDGWPDWAASESNSTSSNFDFVTRALGGPTGEFACEDYHLGYQKGDQPSSIARGDLDGDGDIDLAVASEWDDEVVTLSNDGSGGFVDPLVLPMGDDLQDVELVDLDGDGVLDVVVASAHSSEVWWRAGDGAGGFGSAVGLATLRTVGSEGERPSDVLAADVNGDGVLDLLTANQDTDDVSLLVGLGGGAFLPADIVPAVFAGAPANPIALDAGDLNGDGTLDLVIANQDRDSVSVLFGLDGSVFAAPQELSVGAGPTALVVLDLDGDGLDDIATADHDDGTVTVLLSQGQGAGPP